MTDTPAVPSRDELLVLDVDVAIRSVERELASVQEKRAQILAADGPDQAFWAEGCFLLEPYRERHLIEVVKRLVAMGVMSIRFSNDEGFHDYFSGDFLIQAPNEQVSIAIMRSLIRTAGGDPDSGRGGCCGSEEDWKLWGAYPLDSEHVRAHQQDTTTLSGDEASAAIDRFLEESARDEARMLEREELDIETSDELLAALAGKGLRFEPDPEE